MLERWKQGLWRLTHRSETRATAENDRIASLQEAAKQRRAEYAAAQARADGNSPAPDSGALALSRRRVQEAEAAHAAALTAWNDREFRGKSH